jgi:hypothetical protein
MTYLSRNGILPLGDVRCAYGVQTMARLTSSGYVNVSPRRALCIMVTVCTTCWNNYKTLGSARTVFGCVCMVLAITRDLFPLQH